MRRGGGATAGGDLLTSRQRGVEGDESGYCELPGAAALILEQQFPSNTPPGSAHPPGGRAHPPCGARLGRAPSIGLGSLPCPSSQSTEKEPHA